MAQEIERKFLVQGDFSGLAVKKLKITQGYLSLDKARTVRIRIQDELSFITIKGITNAAGLSRYEWEKEINRDEAEELLKLAIGIPIQKTRYLIPLDNHLFEVDVFEGENNGLIIAEVELQSEADFFTRPNWLGKEVSGDIRYYNANLILKPFKSWGVK